VRNQFLFAACIAAAVSAAQVSIAQAASTGQAEVKAQTEMVPAPPTAGPSVLNFLAPDHATIMVKNIDVERDWYIRVFGATVLRNVHNGHSDMTMIQIPGYRIDLLSPKDMDKSTVGQPKGPHLGWTHVDFSLPPEEIESAYNVLKVRGTDVKPSTMASSANKEHPGQMWLIGLHDPEGNEIEIVARGYY
jgi:catechol 2,3-dioxygenase-like lactoylglutathione lyase family enzyme